MKSPSFSEFQVLIQFLYEELVGAQLQEMSSSDDGLVLGFYRFTKSPRTIWLVFDLDSQYPFLGLFEQHPWPKIKKTKPVTLFINSHFKNTHLKNIQLLNHFGRVAEFDFSLPGQELKLQVRLIPKQPNLIATAQAKSISWEKPRDLVPVSHDEDYESENRSIPYMFKQWWDRRAKIKTSGISSSESLTAASSNTGESPFGKWVRQQQKDQVKKQKALSQIDDQIKEMQKVPWVDIGNYLKVYGYKNFPVDWVKHIDMDLRVSQNIEKVFEKSKQTVHKIKGALERQKLIQSEIQLLNNLSEARYQEYLQKLALKQNKQGQRKASEGSFRRLTIEGDSHVQVLMGKNAGENIKLLRQAKSWDFWVHLKDYPSAYAILQRPKDKNISDHILIQASQWLIKESLKNKKNIEGIKLSVVIVECRHVRPIKGDKLGRVTYHYPREMLISV